MKKLIILFFVCLLFTSCWPKVKVEQSYVKNDKYKYAYVIKYACMDGVAPEISDGLVKYLFDESDFVQIEGYPKFYILSNKNIFNVKEDK